MQASNRLVNLIEQNADKLSRTWLSLVRAHPNTPTYHTCDEKKLYDRAYRVYSQLGRWLSNETTKEQIAELYTALGIHRKEEGFPLPEVIQGLTMTRRVLWFEVLESGFLDSALDLHMAIEVFNRVIHFFDQAIHFAAVGYERADKPVAGRA